MTTTELVIIAIKAKFGVEPTKEQAEKIQVAAKNQSLSMDAWLLEAKKILNIR